MAGGAKISKTIMAKIMAKYNGVMKMAQRSQCEMAASGNNGGAAHGENNANVLA
jgi:hypothetical protein